MFLLIHRLNGLYYYPLGNLHSNMFLLILKAVRMRLKGQTVFTFQYVSINTLIVPMPPVMLLSYLHSNMFLLIHSCFSTEAMFRKAFTFQYVSINTTAHLQKTATETFNLHSNMFLLILLEQRCLYCTCQNLHSNMFLLIRKCSC